MAKKTGGINARTHQPAFHSTDRDRYVACLRQMESEMRADLNRADETIQAFRTAIKGCKSPKYLKSKLDIGVIHRLLSPLRHSLEARVRPANAPNSPPQKSRASTTQTATARLLPRDPWATKEYKAWETKEIAELVRDPEKAVLQYAKHRASISWYDGPIPQAANIVARSLRARLLPGAPMLWRKTNLAGELPPEDADDTEFRSFWDKVILPALQTDYPELLRVSEDDPLGAVRQRIAAIELLARLLESGSSPAAKENDGGNAKPDADDVLDKIDMAILTALSKSKSSLLLEELAENAGYQRKTCGKHVERLLNAGLLTRKSKRSGVAITAAGRARIAPTKLP